MRRSTCAASFCFADAAACNALMLKSKMHGATDGCLAGTLAEATCMHGCSAQAWAALQPWSQNTITVGGNFQSTNGKWDPSMIAVNGVACKIVKQ